MDEQNEKILSIDIGGSHIKATVLNSNGDFLKDYEKQVTPKPSSPEKVMAVIKDLAKAFPEYDKIAAGFPGYMKNGVVKTAPKLGNAAWKNYDLQTNLKQMLGKPALAINDADLQGIALAQGKGFEMVITLGTGLGSALINNGLLLPHLEMSILPITKSKTYNDYVGEDALVKIGKEKWNKRMQKIIDILKTVFNYDHLFISGGNARFLSFKLDANITIDDNKDGIKGGAILWKQKNLELTDKKITHQPETDPDTKN
ncbi:MAG: ROK family protein [Bacteroidota bacterium]|nr:ROK family protein [Bacteroidota bacterium]